MLEARESGIEAMEGVDADILEVATRVFAEKGYRGADVQDIADRAGVGKGTVYRHFGSKKELFLAAVDRGTRKLSDMMLAHVSQFADPVQTIRSAMRKYLEFFDQNQELVEVFIQERSEFRGESKATYFTYRDNNISVLEDILRDGIEKGIFRPHNVKRTSEIICDLAFGTIVAGLMRGNQEALVSRTEDILELCLNGICRQENSEGIA